MKLQLIENWGRGLWDGVAAKLAMASGALTAMMVASPRQWADIMEAAPWWAKVMLVLLVWGAPASTQVVRQVQ